MTGRLGLVGEATEGTARLDGDNVRLLVLPFRLRLLAWHVRA